MKHAAVVIDINEADPIVIPLDEEVSNNIYYRSIMFRIITDIGGIHAVTQTSDGLGHI